jgi:hypothetical protein
MNHSISALDGAIARIGPLGTLLDALLSRIAPHASAAAYSCCSFGFACVNVCLDRVCPGVPCGPCWQSPPHVYCTYTLYASSDSQCSNGVYNGCAAAPGYCC